MDFAARRIIAHCEINHDGKPDEARGDENPRKTRAVTNVHEEKDYQEHFKNGDCERSDDVQRAEVETSDDVSGQEENEQREPNDGVGASGGNRCVHEYRFIK